MLLRATAVAVAFLAEAAFAQRPGGDWPENYFTEQPRDFRVNTQPEGGDCHYQLTFLRNRYDSSFSFFFEAQYPNDPPRLIPYTRGDWYTARTGPNEDNLYVVDDEFQQLPFVLPYACSNGTAPYSTEFGEQPVSFRVIFDVPWISDPIPVEDIATPEAVRNFDGEVLANGDTLLTWEETSGAERYFLVLRGTVRAHVGDVDTFWTEILPVGTNNYTVDGGSRLQSAVLLPEGEPGIYDFLFNIAVYGSTI